MPIFGEAATPFDETVEKVTAETLTSENWDLMLGICDRVVAGGQKACKQCLISVKKRLNHRDPHVILLALSLLDCLWNNCGATFRREVSSKEFISELNYKATNSNRVVGEKNKRFTFTGGISLQGFAGLRLNLRRFQCVWGKKKTVFSNDPNVVHTEEEEADIAKAIALSLNDAKEKEKKPQKQSSYPSFNSAQQQQPSNSIQQQQQQPAVHRQVKALYDFEAAEDNEITFGAGEIITLLDDSDPNWWRGATNRGTGLFPASFVTHDLQPTPLEVKGSREEQSASVQPILPRVQIDEEILLKCIQLLESCDPTGVVPDPTDLAYYEQMSLAQAPLIDNKLAQIDKQHNMLAQMDVAIRDVLASYDNSVQQVQYQMQHQQPYTSQSSTYATSQHAQIASVHPGGPQLPPPNSNYPCIFTREWLLQECL
uniref:Signal transducing adapter molecule 1 n=1 Tax=Ditylenchus dipsaci TaxID=166011 RepID=A0A915D6Y3_9BILA